MINFKNEKNKSSVILNPERSEWVSRSHVTGVEPVVNDGAKTKHYSAKRDLYARSPNGSRLKMTAKVLSFLRLCCASEKQKESSLILREAKFQAIFKFVLSSASGGAGGGKYNRISAFDSMLVLLIRRALEFFRVPQKNRDDSFSFLASPKDTFYHHSEPKAKNPKNNIKYWILRFANAPFRMTIPALALIFTLITTAESRAECRAKEQNWLAHCYNTWKPGEANNCGDGCTYTYNNGKLTVTATKLDAVIPEGMFSPSYYEPGIYPNVTGIEIAGEFKTIGQHAFLDNAATISGKGGVLYTNNINHNAFGNDNTLTGTIIVSDKKTTLGQGPWYYANLNATVILPPTIKSISGMAIEGLKLGPNAKIYCGVENCEELFKNVDCDAIIDEQYVTRCKNNLKTLLDSGKLLTYPDGCTKMGASGCTKCKNENFKLNDGECDRLRWTPAEAAEVLTDDNNNSVTITFKK